MDHWPPPLLDVRSHDGRTAVIVNVDNGNGCMAAYATAGSQYLDVEWHDQQDQPGTPYGRLEGNHAGLYRPSLLDGSAIAHPEGWPQLGDEARGLYTKRRALVVMHHQRDPARAAALERWYHEVWCGNGGPGAQHTHQDKAAV